MIYNTPITAHLLRFGVSPIRPQIEIVRWYRVRENAVCMYLCLISRLLYSVLKFCIFWKFSHLVHPLLCFFLPFFLGINDDICKLFNIFLCNVTSIDSFELKDAQ